MKIGSPIVYKIVGAHVFALRSAARAISYHTGEVEHEILQSLLAEGVEAATASTPEQLELTCNEIITVLAEAKAAPAVQVDLMEDPACDR